MLFRGLFYEKFRNFSGMLDGDPDRCLGFPQLIAPPAEERGDGRVPTPP